MTKIAYSAVPALAHEFSRHPENNARVPAILDGLREAGLLAELRELTIQPATKAQIASCHTPEFIESLEATMAQAPGYIDSAPTYITSDSFDCALQAAGGAIAAVDAVIDSASNGQINAALALVRPPGHHAERGRAMGFCLFGNISVAARHAQARGLQRVMIVDFDVHHGNGTQDIFYADDSVYFISTHQRGIYPGSGSEYETGSGSGSGYTLNVPLPAGAGDQAMRTVFEQLIRPAAAKVKPELILVSAGFDGHFLDPLAGLQFSGAGYHQLAAMLAALATEYAQGRIVFVLEGGYHLNGLSNGVVNVVQALRGAAADETLGRASVPEPDISKLVQQLQQLHDLS